MQSSIAFFFKTFSFGHFFDIPFECNNQNFNKDVTKKECGRDHKIIEQRTIDYTIQNQFHT